MTQDTRVDEEARIQEDIASAEVVREVEPAVVTKGEEGLPLEADEPMKVSVVSSAGYRYLYDTETKERVPILHYMLAQQMRKKRADGMPRFSARKPAGEPFRGTFKCLLHQSNPQRDYFNSIGFRVCRKDNIQSPHALTQHMRLKHPQEWKLIEGEREKKEKEEDRELQRAILGKVANVEEPKVEEPCEVCDVCGKLCKSKLGLIAHKRSHK